MLIQRPHCERQIMNLLTSKFTRKKESQKIPHDIKTVPENPPIFVPHSFHCTFLYTGVSVTIRMTTSKGNFSPDTVPLLGGAPTPPYFHDVPLQFLLVFSLMLKKYSCDFFFASVIIIDKIPWLALLSFFLNFIFLLAFLLFFLLNL